MIFPKNVSALLSAFHGLSVMEQDILFHSVKVIGSLHVMGQ